MAPWAHEPLHRHPTRPLVKQVLHGLKIGYRLHNVRQQFDFESLLRYQSSSINVIRWAVLDDGVSTVGQHRLPRRNDRLSESYIQIVELPGDHDWGEKIRNHSDRLQFLYQVCFLGRNV